MSKDIKEKRCSKCKKIKLIEEFKKDKSHKDGLSSACKICEHKNFIKNKDKINKRRRKRYAQNIDKEREYRRNYYKNNLDKGRQRARDYYKNNIEKCRQKVKEYYFKNKEQINTKCQKRRQKNPEKQKIYSYNYYKNNIEKCRQKVKEYHSTHKEERRQYRQKRKKQRNAYIRYKYNNDLNYRLKNIMSTKLYRALTSTKKGKKWELLVGYNIKNFKYHIEKQFKKGMSWNNYGKLWQIDHIFPISWFKFKSYNDIDFKLCWSLDNMQPLWKIDNQKKNKYEHFLFFNHIIDKININFLKKLIVNSKSKKVKDIAKKLIQIKYRNNNEEEDNCR